MSRLRLILPFLMLVGAALACDMPEYDPPRVQTVWAADGIVYALVGSALNPVVYQTTDAGATWERAPEGTPIVPFTQAVAIDRQGDTFWLADQPLWSFPRPTFRFFFLNDPDGQYFALPYRPHNVIVGETIYIAMGTEGVLVGPAPGSSSPQPWRLTNTGLDPLNPLPLTIAAPDPIAGIVALGLLIPPLALLHAYALSRPLRYVLDPRSAWRRALLTTLILTALAAVAIVIWLTDVRTDYYGIVTVMTAIVAVAGAGVTWAAARRAGVSPAVQFRLMLAGGLVSLIVPGGVASIWTAWWAVFVILIGYLLLRLPFVRAAARAGVSLADRGTRARIDWFGVSAALISGLITGLTGTILFFNPFYYPLRSIAEPVIALVGVVVIVVAIVRLSDGRMRRWIDGLAGASASAPADMLRRFRREMIAAAIGALVLIAGGSYLTFAAQALAYAWFTSLLVPA
ncbi:MAG: hypothetical protein ACUVS2_13990 [Candidatus Flexifilum sp.]|jgi:hypothetical protein